MIADARWVLVDRDRPYLADRLLPAAHAVAARAVPRPPGHAPGVRGGRRHGLPAHARAGRGVNARIPGGASCWRRAPPPPCCRASSGSRPPARHPDARERLRGLRPALAAAAPRRPDRPRGRGVRLRPPRRRPGGGALGGPPRARGRAGRGGPRRLGRGRPGGDPARDHRRAHRDRARRGHPRAGGVRRARGGRHRGGASAPSRPGWAGGGDGGRRSRCAAPWPAGPRPWSAWAASRALILVAAVAASAAFGVPTRGVDAAVPDLLRQIGGWDTTWYLDVARNGYAEDLGQVGEVFTNLAFFPLMPGIMAAFIAIGINPFIGALVVSNVAFLGALWALHALTADRWGEQAATRATWILALAPPALYCSMAYTEGLAVACAVAAALCAVRGRYVLAGLIAAVGVADPADRRARGAARGDARAVRPRAGADPARPSRPCCRASSPSAPSSPGWRSPGATHSCRSRPSAPGTAASSASACSRRRPTEIARRLGAGPRGRPHRGLARDGARPRLPGRPTSGSWRASGGPRAACARPGSPTRSP